MTPMYKPRHKNKLLVQQFLASGMKAARLCESYADMREAYSRRDSINKSIMEQDLKQVMDVCIRKGTIYLYRKED